jgi:hypothetical protein
MIRVILKSLRDRAYLRSLAPAGIVPGFSGLIQWRKGRPQGMILSMKTQLWMLAAIPLLGLSHAGCRACTPNINPTDSDSGRKDTSNPDTQETTEHTGETGETGEPPPCAQPELEPNGSVANAQTILLEKWVCGTFLDGIDLEHMLVEFEVESWVKVDVRAASHGSSADPTLEMRSEEGDIIRSFGRLGSTDPLVIFPLWEADDWIFKLWESFGGAGEDHTWDLMVSVTKQPTSWTRLESEEPLDEGPSNDSLGAAEELTPGEVIFGRMGSPNDVDWFRFTPPEDKTDVSIHVAAYNFGSPLDARLARYTPDGTQVQVMTHGDMAADPDPVMRFSSDSDDEQFFILRSDSYEGLAYWYTVWIEYGSDN